MFQNSLIEKALKASNKNAEELFVSLKGASAVMFSETSNGPAKLIKEYRKDGKRPILKSAFVDAEIYIGDNQLASLVALKSRNELIGDIIGLLQSPMKRVLGGMIAKAEKEGALEIA